MPLTWIAIAGLSLLVVTGLLIVVRMARSRKRELLALNRQIDILRSDISALCAGAVGADRRVTRLEMQGRSLDHRQESMESRQQEERPYGEAIQMVHEGATVDDLVERLGLSLSEADLVVMLHGVKQAV